jgi:hypothetical protein
VFGPPLVFPGCSSILEDDILSVTAHEKPAVTTEESVIEANSYDELKACLLDFIKGRVETGLIRVNSYDAISSAMSAASATRCKTTIRTPLTPSPA